MRKYFDGEERINPNFIRRTAKYHTLKQLNLKMALEGFTDFNNKKSIFEFEDNEQPTYTAKKGTGYQSKFLSKKPGNENNDDKSNIKNNDAPSKNTIKKVNNLRNSVRTKSKTNTSLPYVPINLNNNNKNTKPYEKTTKNKEKATKFNGTVTKTIFSNNNNNSKSNKNIFLKSMGPSNKPDNSSSSKNIFLKSMGPSIKTDNSRSSKNIFLKTTGPSIKADINKKPSDTITVKRMESTPLKSAIIHSASGRLYNLGQKKEENNNNNTQTHRNNFLKHESRVSDNNLQYKVNEGEQSRAKLFEEKRESRRRTTGLKRRATKEYEEFNTNIYTKFCEATTTAGRDDDGKKKTNQDTYVLEKNINGVINFNIFGVLDGHGVNGHYASNFTKKYLLERIKNHPLIKNLQTPNEIYKQLTMNGYQIIAKIFVDADTQIAKEKFNVEMSGTTCVIVIQLGERLICANAGDSRAILVYEEKNTFNLSNTKIFMLSYDCKPEIPLEKRRIEANGGVVSQIIDEEDGQPSGSFRVWVKGKTYPGIAISRSIGDIDAKTVGVIPNPQIIEYKLTPQSKYMMICSDGIWEYLSNEEVMEFAKNFYIKKDALGLCKELTKKSTELWLKDDVVVDDITVVAVFF